MREFVRVENLHYSINIPYTVHSTTASVVECEKLRFIYEKQIPFYDTQWTHDRMLEKWFWKFRFRSLIAKCWVELNLLPMENGDRLNSEVWAFCSVFRSIQFPVIEIIYKELSSKNHFIEIVDSNEFYRMKINEHSLEKSFTERISYVNSNLFNSCGIRFFVRFHWIDRK